MRFRFLAALLGSVAFLASPALAQTTPNIGIQTQSGAIGTVCNMEARPSASGPAAQCDPWAVSNQTAHTFTALPTFLGGTYAGTSVAAPSSYFATFGEQNSSTTPSAVYGPGVPPGWYFVDGHSSTMLVPSTATAVGTSAYSYYVRNQAVSQLGAPNAPNSYYGNATGLFGIITCEVNGCSSWGLNPTVTDGIAGGTTISTTNRKLIAAEFDISVHGTGTTVQGITLLGSSTAQPAFAAGYTVGSLGGPAKWNFGFNTADGVATTAFQAGATATSGTTIPSQPINLNYFNSSAVEKTMQEQANNDSLNITSTGNPDGFYFLTGSGNIYIGSAGTDATVNLNLTPKGSGTVIVPRIKVTPGTYAALVAAYPCGASTEGNFAAITDSTSVTYNNPAAGGGSNHVPVYCNGTAYTVH